MDTEFPRGSGAPVKKNHVNCKGWGESSINSFMLTVIFIYFDDFFN